MEMKLNNIWLNGKKIVANLSKYKRREVTKVGAIQGVNIIFKGGKPRRGKD